MTGKFITFEGGEGSGKSTQARLLHQRLNDQGIETILTREPGGSPGAEEIRKLLVEGEPERWLPDTEALLFLAARMDHVNRLVKPALAKGTWVISDRFFDSSFVYQGMVRGFGMDRLEMIHDLVLNKFEPDLTLILDGDAALGLGRARSGRFEKFGPEFHAKIREEYLTIAACDPNRCIVIAGNRSIEEIGAGILSVVRARFNV